MKLKIVFGTKTKKLLWQDSYQDIQEFTCLLSKVTKLPPENILISYKDNDNENNAIEIQEDMDYLVSQLNSNDVITIKVKNKNQPVKLDYQFATKREEPIRQRDDHVEEGVLPMYLKQSSTKHINIQNKREYIDQVDMNKDNNSDILSDEDHEYGDYNVNNAGCLNADWYRNDNIDNRINLSSNFFNSIKKENLNRVLGSFQKMNVIAVEDESINTTINDSSDESIPEDNTGSFEFLPSPLDKANANNEVEAKEQAKRKKVYNQAHNADINSLESAEDLYPLIEGLYTRSELSLGNFVKAKDDCKVNMAIPGKDQNVELIRFDGLYLGNSSPSCELLEDYINDLINKYS